MQLIFTSLVPGIVIGKRANRWSPVTCIGLFLGYRLNFANFFMSAFQVLRSKGILNLPCDLG